MPAPDAPPSLIAERVAALCNQAGLATILDGIGDGFYAVDRDWRIILFNAEAERHFRRPPDQLHGVAAIYADWGCVWSLASRQVYVNLVKPRLLESPHAHALDLRWLY